MSETSLINGCGVDDPTCPHCELGDAMPGVRYMRIENITHGAGVIRIEGLFGQYHAFGVSPWRMSVLDWYFPCCQVWCDTCQVVRNEDESPSCENCEGCPDCCDCVSCDDCGEYVNDGDWCQCGEHCTSCCACVFCPGCNERYQSPRFCCDCRHCHDCCVCEEEEEEEVGDDTGEDVHFITYVQKVLFTPSSAGWYERNDTSTILPYVRTVGHEAEYAGSARKMLSVLYAQKAIDEERLHGYHCSCEASHKYPVHQTSDCTASGGEWIIGGPTGLTAGSSQYDATVQILSDAAVEANMGISSEVGGHVHVGSDDLEMSEKRLVVRNYLAVQNDLQSLMRQGMGKVRSNGCTSALLSMPFSSTYRQMSDYDLFNTYWDELSFVLPLRPTLNFGSLHTIEFRAWNACKAAWRFHMAANVSSAIVQAAKDHLVAKPGMSVLDHVGDYLTPDVRKSVIKQLSGVHA